MTSLVKCGVNLLWLTVQQGLSQDLETGCPKIGKCEILGVKSFQGKS